MAREGAIVALEAGAAVAVPADASMNPVDWIAAAVTAMPHGIMRSVRGRGDVRTQTYGALWQRSGRLAGLLSTAAKQAPDGQPRLAILLFDDVLDFVPAFWACLRSGVVAVPLAGIAGRTPDERDALLDGIDDPVILADPRFAELASEIVAQCGGVVLDTDAPSPMVDFTDRPLSDPACLIATSGSTGRSKLVALGHASLVRRYLLGSALKAEQRYLGTYPLDSISGLRCVYLRFGAWTQLSGTIATTEPATVLDLVQSYAITGAALTRNVIAAVAAAETARSRARDLCSLTTVGIGGEPIGGALLETFGAVLARGGVTRPILNVGYGTTETGPLVTGAAFDGTAQADGMRLGRPLPGVSIRLREMQDAGGLGDLGEIEVLCPGRMFDGYWGDAASGADRLTADGWWQTGDLGRFVDGQLVIHGRSKEVLIVNGRKIALAAIDAELQTLLSVGEAAHAVRSDDGEGETVSIVLTLAEDPAAREEVLRDLVPRALLRRFALRCGPIAVLARDQLPFTESGKLRRGELAAVLRRGSSGGQSGLLHPTASGYVPQRLADIWQATLGLDACPDLDQDFFDLGGDSLRAIALYSQVVDAFGVHIPSDEFFIRPTLRHLTKLVATRRQSGAPSASSEIMPEFMPWAWPLPADMRGRLSMPLATWPGQRVTRDRLVMVLNAGGHAAPIVWVFNEPHEFVNLARALGEDQPLYGFRSGVRVIDYTEDEIQQFALRYVSEIEEAGLSGPLIIGGNCQGGVLALAIAQHAQRRRWNVPLLVLMDWASQPFPYAGRVLLIAGRDNPRQNLRHLFDHFGDALPRLFAASEFVELDYGYTAGLDEPAVSAIAGLLKSRLLAAVEDGPSFLPSAAYQVGIDVVTKLGTLTADRDYEITVEVSNRSPVVWRSGAGLTLSARWCDRRGSEVHDFAGASTALPQIMPGESVSLPLTIRSPVVIGGYRLAIDVVEQGCRWFTPPLRRRYLRLAVGTVTERAIGTISRYLRS